MDGWTEMTDGQILIGCLTFTHMTAWEGDRDRMLVYRRKALLLLQELAAEETDYREYYLRLARGHAENWGLTLDGTPLPA